MVLNATDLVCALKPHEVSNLVITKCTFICLQRYAKFADIRQLESFKHTDEVARSLTKLDRIDALVLNAGLGVGVYNETKDGVDSHMYIPPPMAPIAVTDSPAGKSTSSLRFT